MLKYLAVEKSRKAMVEIGAAAPDFVLRNETGADWRLSGQRGQVTALLFYPQDETLVCTKQMCAVRDNWTKYLETKAVVVGISPGDVAQHSAFAARHRLPLAILADPQREITKIYSYHPWMPAWLTRAIVIIDAKGIIRSRKVMARAFRPTDYSVLAAIYAARNEVLNERYDSLKRHRKDES